MIPARHIFRRSVPGGRRGGSGIGSERPTARPAWRTAVHTAWCAVCALIVAVCLFGWLIAAPVVFIAMLAELLWGLA